MLVPFKEGRSRTEPFLMIMMLPSLTLFRKHPTSCLFNLLSATFKSHENNFALLSSMMTIEMESNFSFLAESILSMEHFSCHIQSNIYVCSFFFFGLILLCVEYFVRLAGSLRYYTDIYHTLPILPIKTIL